MDFDQGKRSGQIPTFGDWDNANELPITQYFESARQAGLVRYPDQFHHSHNITNARGCGGGYGYPVHPHAADFQKPPIRLVGGRGGVGVGVPPLKARGTVSNNNGESNNRNRYGCPPHVKEQKMQMQKQKQQRIVKQIQPKVYDVVDVKQQLPRHRTRSQQLFYDNKNNNNNNQKQKQKQKQQHFPKHSAATPPSLNVKPVDEDLYKIPPELLLHNSKRKKMLGFFSKCLVPPCKA